jgi:hypothetical protein
MARIYVSSTFSDLREYRYSVYRALRRLGHDAVAMEDSVAADQRPLDQCLAEVAASDVYIGIFAHRYGYVPEHDNPFGRSITELEYRNATALAVPCLIFLLDPAVPWPPRFLDVVTGEGDKGARIQALREELSRDRLVGFFSSPDELAQQVAVATTRLLADGGPAPAGASVGGVTLQLISASRDERLMHELRAHIASLERAGLVSAVSDYLVNQGDAELLDHADVVLVMLSTELLSTGYLESDGFRWLVEQHTARQLQLIPVLLRPISWSSLPSSLQQIPPLPGADRSVTDSSNRDAAFIDVVEGVRLACLEIVARRRRTPGSSQPPRTGRTHYRLVEVFKESGVPSVTFVEPDNFYQLKLALEQPGRGVVIEGPSGVGKTTALHTAIKQLDTAIVEDFEMLSARNRADIARIAKLPSWHHGAVAIDDFHRLDPAIRAELVDYLKLLADTEPTDRKLVIVGIPGTRQTLVQIAYDIATRIGFLSLGTVHDDKVKEMIEKGEAALNVELVGKSEIVRAAVGSLNVAQILCQNTIALAGIRETQTILTPVESELPRAIQAAMDMMTPKFKGLVQSFAALDGPSERFCIQLLMELATANDGTLSLWQLGDRQPDLQPNIDHFVSEHPIGTLRKRHPEYDQHLLYDQQTATLVIDDPQLTFYLRQLNSEQLALTVGKRPLAKRTRIFVSYSHNDAEWLNRLRVHLKPLEREGLIDLWDDTRIAAGSLWREQIDAALDSARVAVLLISADFLASDFIIDNELLPLLDAAERDGCTVLPLLVQPSLFEQTPQLNRFQTVNRNAPPLSDLPTADRERVLVALAKEIGSLVKRQRV